MSDFNSSSPVRTENNGDVVAKIGDGTTPSQQLAIDSSGRIIAKLTDGTGTAITSQTNGAQRALDVGIDVAGVQIDPRQVRALTVTDVVTTQQGTSPWISKDQADGPVAPGTAASFSNLVGGVYNSTPPTATTGQQLALQTDASGRLITVSTVTSTDDHNYGTVGATTFRVASQIGNATGAANFNTGVTGAQTLRVESNQGAANTIPWTQNLTQIVGATPSATNALPSQITTAGAFVSNTNPLPVFVTTDRPGVEINDYNTASAIAAGATSNHDYTVTAAKTFYLTQISGSSSGKMKVEIQFETAAGSGIFTSKFVRFNSTANPNIDLLLQSPITQVAGAKIRIIRTNKDLQAQDLYTTTSGNEV